MRKISVERKWDCLMLLEHVPMWQVGQENDRQWINWFGWDVDKGSLEIF